MKRLISNKGEKASYGPKWQNIESSSDSDNDNDDDLHSPTAAGSTQISGNEAAGNQNQIQIAKDGELMHLAALQGDWVAAEVLLGRDPNLGFDYVTEEGDRALHVAAAMKHEKFVEKLVERMSEKDLALVDGHGYTACCYAAISGEVGIARLIIGKSPNLVTALPLREAALRGNKGMLSFLLKSTQVEDLSREEWFDLLIVTIRCQLYGVYV